MVVRQTARTAYSPFTSFETGVGLVIGMAVRAMSFGKVPISVVHRPPTPDVFPMRYRLKMVGVTALRDAALVVYFETRRNGPLVNFVQHPMRE
jgi:hypothetical protein